MFEGSFVAIITPFKNGKLDEKKLAELVEWHISEGTDGLVPVGTTGESPTLSYKEHGRVIEVVTKTARKRLPVIAGAGSNSTEEAIELSLHAKSVGVDAILSVNPYYNRPTQEGLIAHFSTIAKKVNVPMVLYNIPSRTNVTLSVDTIVKLVEKNPQIIGIKESTGSLDHSSEIKQRLGNKICLLSGDDSLTLPLISVGATGVISVAANLVPSEISRLCQLALSGDFDQARQLHLKLFPLVKSLFIETNPAPIKAAMKMAKLISDASIRLPMVDVSPATRKKIAAEMKNFGLR